MTIHQRRPWAFLVVLLAALSLAFVACDDGDGEGDDGTATTTPPASTATSAPPASPTSTATPSDSEGSNGGGLDDPRVALELVADGLNAPVHMAAPDDGSGRIFVVEQTGTIRIVGDDGTVSDEPFLDVTDRMVELNEGFDERGLLGMAFHPDFGSNGQFYVYYSAPLQDGAPEGWDHTSTVSEFTVSGDNEDMADPASERVIILIDEPQFNHNAGHLQFGPDGYLYIPLGDGGGGNDNAEGHTPDLGNGQDRSNLLGSVLRIDVDAEGEAGEGYAIPDDNPFVDAEGDVRPEIWVYGLRNPFDISFDPDGEYDLFIADAGQALFEWVNLAEGGENFGWNITEGSNCFDPDDEETVPDECASEGADGEPLVDPVVEYSRDELGTVITGVRLYRGTALSDYQGMLFITDWSADGSANGALIVAEPGSAGESWDWEQVSIEMEGASEGDDLGVYFTSLGAGPDGELYVLANSEAAPVPGSGAIYRIVSAEGSADGAGGSDGTATATPTGSPEASPTGTATETATETPTATATAGGG